MQRYYTHPGMAAILSFVVNGLGQLYVGDIKKGLWIIFLSATSMLLIVLGAVFLGFAIYWRIFSSSIMIIGLALFFIGFSAICFIGMYSIFDAYNSAKKNL